MIILDDYLNLDDYFKIVYRNEGVKISEKAAERVKKNREIVDKIINIGKPIYGLNTGFGNLANVKIELKNIEKLQVNLIRSHATGTGEKAPYEIVRGTILLRLQSLLKGYSGVQYKNLFVFEDYLNNNIYPYVPSLGSLGASGDLAPLSHIILSMLGEGEVIDEKGERVKSIKLIEEKKLKKLELSYKEGLAFINGTSFMLASLIDSIYKIIRLIKLFDLVSSFSIENLKGTLTPFRKEISMVRPHEGQIKTAENIFKILKDSEIIESHKNCPKVQDAYSLRCIPQVHGAVKEVLKDVINKVNVEMNSVTDNPLIFAEDKIYSGGNFHGEILAFYADFLSIALSELGSISERRLERILNPALSGLPPFLAEDAGIESGLMIVQYTVASLVSLNKSYATPSSIDSIPVSANQEDHVSMGANACYKLSKIVENLWFILAAELFANLRAKIFHKEKFSEVNSFVFDYFSKKIDIKYEDFPYYKILEEMVSILKNEDFLNEIEEKIGGILY